MARTILSSGLKVSVRALFVQRDIFVRPHPQTTHHISAVPDTFALQDQKYHLKCHVGRERFALFRWGLPLTIVLRALRVIFALKQQYRLLSAPSATSVLLPLISHLLAPWDHSEIPPCLQVRMIALHAHQDFIVTEVLHRNPVADVIQDIIVREVLHLPLLLCSSALKEASAPKELISLRLVHLEHSTTKRNLVVLSNV